MSWCMRGWLMLGRRGRRALGSVETVVDYMVATSAAGRSHWVGCSRWNAREVHDTPEMHVQHASVHGSLGNMPHVL